MQIIECAIPFPEGLQLTDTGAGECAKKKGLSPAPAGVPLVTTISMRRGEFIAPDPMRHNENWLVTENGFRKIEVRNCVIPVNRMKVRSVVG